MECGSIITKKGFFIRRNRIRGSECPTLKKNYFTTSFIFVLFIKYEEKTYLWRFSVNLFIKIKEQFKFFDNWLRMRIHVPNMHPDPGSEYAPDSTNLTTIFGYRKKNYFSKQETTKYIYTYSRVTQCLSPIRNWDSPTPSSASQCATPPDPKGGYATHSTACEGLGESKLGRLKKKPNTLSTLCKKLSNIVLVN